MSAFKNFLRLFFGVPEDAPEISDATAYLYLGVIFVVIGITLTVLWEVH